MGALHNLQTLEGELEKLTVDKASETADDQAAEKCVYDGIEFEDDLPVSVEFNFFIFKGHLAIRLAAHIVCFKWRWRGILLTVFLG